MSFTSTIRTASVSLVLVAFVISAALLSGARTAHAACQIGQNSPCTDAVIPIGGFPNLVPFAVSSPSIPQGSTVTMSVNVWNTTMPVFPWSTDSDLNTPFQNTFQIALADQSSIVETIGNIQINSIAANHSANVTRTSSYTFPAAGTYYYRLCADTRPTGYPWNEILEPNEDDNCSAWTAITVSAPPVSDLTPGSASTVSAAMGQAVTVSGTVSNIGNASTGASFNNMFVTNLNGAGTAWNTIRDAAPASGNLAPGGSASFSATFPAGTFAAPGSYQYAYCVDMNSAWAGTISESNEGNNCVGGTIVIYAVPTASLSLSPASIAYGGSSTVSWSSSAATSCTGTNFNTGGATSGAVAVSATANTTYTVWCSGPGGSATDAKTLTVGAQTFPDLTPGAAPTIYAPFGQAVTVTGTAANIGNGATGASFNNLFVTNLNAAGTAWNTAVTAAPATGNLAPGGSASFSYTFPASTFAAPGSYQYAYCNDFNGSWATLITESNEGNNCVGGVIVVTVPDLTAATGGASSGIPGTSVSLGGTVSNIGNGSSGVAVQNTVQVCDSGCATYNQYGTVSTAGPLAAGASQPVAATRPVPPTIGTYYYRVCANINAAWTAYPITESDYGNNCGVWQVLAVTAPDLTAGAVSPTSATGGTPVTFSATASNIGTGASGSFPILFRITENGALFTSAYVAGIAPGGTGVGTASYTFPSSSSDKTYTVSACANFNAAWTAITTESDYGNNCGPDTVISVPKTPPSIPSSCSVSASPTLIPIGASTGLTWSSSGAASCTGSGFSTGGATSGTQSVTPGASTTYGLSCTSSSGGVCNAVPVLVTVGGAGSCSGTPAVSLSASATRVQTSIGSFTLSWSAQNTSAASCSVTGTDGFSTSFAPNLCSVSPTTSAPRTITTQTVYTINCGGVTKSVTVNVVPKFIEF